jgi:hypothetical protein
MKFFSTFLILGLFLSGCASLYDTGQNKIYSFSNSIPLDFKNSSLPLEIQNLIGKTVWSYGENEICENFKLGGIIGFSGENWIRARPLEELMVIDAYIKKEEYSDDQLLVRLQRKLDGKIYARDFSRYIYASLIDAFKDKFTTESPYEKYPKWSQKDWERVKAGEIWIGMTREQAIYSLGHPTESNRTVTASVVSEQWVYPPRVKGYTFYLYFENDKLTSWQD